MMNSQKMQDWLTSLTGQRTPTPAYAKPQTILRLVPFFIGVVGLASIPAQALTLKTGEVLASDGTVHMGASPENRANIIANAKEQDIPAGVYGSNIYVVTGDEVTFVHRNELRGKTKDTMIAIVGDSVVQNLTGNDDITFDDVMAVNDVLASLPDDQIDDFISDIEDMVDEGLADEVNQLMADLKDIDGGLEAIMEYESYDDCVASGGGDVCDQTQAAIDRSGL
ncbi:MAG: hypothetical protein VW836_06695 [Alphaproteobacteria bacterium]